MLKLIHADCLTGLKSVLSNTLDACVTDPPYGLSFMGKHWDYDVPTVELWKEIFRVLKPGAHVLCACGTRTQHRMVVNIEDAGFEIRDVITWHYGSGFPKSMDVSKAMDKAAGAERIITGEGKWNSRKSNGPAGINSCGLSATTNSDHKETTPATDEAKTWDGWGTALKPATEFWTLARKPLSEKTVVENVLKWGTGAINVNGSRVDWDSEALKNDTLRRQSPTVDFRGGKAHAAANNESTHIHTPESPTGRFPANVIFDEFTGGLLDEQSGITSSGKPSGLEGQHIQNKVNAIYGKGLNSSTPNKPPVGDSGGASRFFYCAKSSPSERGDANNHPTVKPLKLMRYLVKLICPPGGTILEPFAGSGTTCVAAMDEGFSFLAYEKEEAYYKIALDRIEI